MNRSIAFRISADILLAIFTIFGLWYFALPIGIACLWIFPRYAELMIAGFAYDALFGMGSGLGIFSAYACTAISLALTALIISAKAMMR